MSDPSLENSSDMSGRKIFELISSAAADGSAARLGKLSLPGKKVIETPNFFAVTSRGAVPHLTPDNLKRHTSVSGFYMALEDFIEKKEPPILQTPGGGFTSTTQIYSPAALAVFTSTGFRNVTVPEFTTTVQALQPDIVLPMADLPHTSATPSSKKLVRMVERTEVWLDEFLDRLASSKSTASLDSSVFAPVLPVEYPIQWDYLRHLSEDVLDKLDGLAVYDANLLPELVNYPPLTPLPKLLLMRAYLHHLLNAKEMLGWNLLQIHNHHVINEFFAGIREALTKGQAVFEEEASRFTASYEPVFPEGTGARPRARGYHFKSEASSDRINKPAWIDLDKEATSAQITSLAESSTPSGESQDATPVAVVNVEEAVATLSIN
ncbi:hypothetical protein TrVFT333_011367 [Trichoderma virens FT-333]|nr:hypothetical protein TrVFT333_011367 [Trichoderma virens FT-333]